MTTKQFAIAEAVINSARYAGLRGQMLQRKVKIGSEGSSGTVHETFHALEQEAAEAELTSFALKSLLVAFATSTDLPMLALNGTTGIVMYGANAAANGPGYDGGSTHFSATGIYGLIFISAIRWTKGEPAEVELKGMFWDGASSGAADPITLAVTVALPTQVVPVEQFALTALIINGNTITSVESLEITFDPKFEYAFNAGFPFPSDIFGAGAHGPLEARLVATINDLTTAVESTGAVSAVFSKYGVSSPAFAAETVTFTFNAPWGIAEQLAGGRQGSPQQRIVTVRPRLAGSTKPVTWAVTP